MRRALKFGVPAAVVGLAAAGFAGWWFLVRGEAPPPVEGVTEQFGTSPTGPAPADAATTTALPETADGRWTIRPMPRVFAGYRIDEELVVGVTTRPAVGRSQGVSGTVTLTGSTVSAADVQVDMTKLKSNEERRDDRMRTGGLETDLFSVATFSLTQPIDLGGPPEVAQVYNATATGDLTLHGVTRSIQLAIEARWSGETVDITGSTTIALADYGINMEPFAGVVTVAPEGTIEFALQYVRS